MLSYQLVPNMWGLIIFREIVAPRNIANTFSDQLLINFRSVYFENVD